MENNDKTTLEPNQESSIQIIEGVYGIDINLINNISKDHPELTKQLLSSISVTLQEETKRNNEYHELIAENEKLRQVLLKKQLKEANQTYILLLINCLMFVFFQVLSGYLGYNALKEDRLFMGTLLILGAIFLQLLTISQIFIIIKSLNKEYKKTNS